VRNFDPTKSEQLPSTVAEARVEAFRRRFAFLSRGVTSAIRRDAPLSAFHASLSLRAR